MERLNKYLSEAGVCSRREADRLIAQGRVSVEGTVATTGCKVEPGQKVCVDGKAVTKTQRSILLVLNKPRGVVCTSDRRWGDRLVEDLLDIPERTYPIGRLDKESEGLLLMTNQGDLLNKIMKSENRHEKEYEVTVDRPLSQEDIRRLAGGLYLPELQRKTRPCRVVQTGKNAFRIILTQGLNRQIRRMCTVIGARVTSLRRVRIMNIHLDDLPVGAYRPVTADEMKALLAQLANSSNNTEKKWENHHDKTRVQSAEKNH